MSEPVRSGLVNRALNALFDRYPRIAYIHLPKCAGTSAVKALRDCVYPGLLKATRAHRPIDLMASNVARRTLGVDMMTAREVMLIGALSDPLARFVAGHVHARPQVVAAFPDWKFVTLLRNPRSRFLSQYVYDSHKAVDWARIDKDFPAYVNSERARKGGMALARYFSGLETAEIEADPDRAVDACLANLDNFFSVGLVEEMDAWIDDIGRSFGRRPKVRSLNRSPRPSLYREIEESEELNAAVDALCAIDARIYEAAKSRLLRPSSPEAEDGSAAGAASQRRSVQLPSAA